MANVKLAKPYLVVLALHELGGEADLESIAVTAHELFPEEFSWRKYPEYPDKDTVRVHLSDAKKPSFGNLVQDRDLRFEGRKVEQVKRYALTQTGFSKAEQLLAEHDIADVSASTTNVEYHRIVEPIFESEAFKRYHNSGSINDVGREAFLSAFKLFPDTSTVRISGRLGRIQKAARRIPDKERQRQLLQFIRDGREKFNV